ncbi:MAG: UDP-2,4-diacetamido-2,4,6-trideoxy-beta-L-altropyranose hydrolase, partial [Pseudobdellovibrionaceae bacterium]
MIVFRCDSSFEIGTGHVTRGLALADKLRSLGLRSHFVCRDLKGHVGSQIQKQGFDLTLLPADADDHAAILLLKPQWLVVDHYQLDESWEKHFEGKTQVFVIDDLVNRKHQCQVLLDQNFHANAEEKYRALTGVQTRLLLGPHFALFKIPDSVPTQKSLSPGPKKVLVFFGGSDQSGETLKFLEALKSHSTTHFFQIVVTNSNPRADQFRAFANGPNHEIFISPSQWPELLKTADFYLG